MYVGLVTLVGLGVVVVGLAYLTQRAVATAREALLVLPFQSGWVPQEHALSRYHVRWYLATLIFLAFDIEMLFMYPWGVVVIEVGATAVIEMGLFLAALMAAVFWAWREGALRWA